MNTADPILDRFSDLNWPGKRKPVNRDLTPVTDKTDQGWDEKPTTYTVNGAPMEFFTISHLSAALGRSIVTIRSWEKRGLLPRTPYSSPKPKGDSLPNVVRKGRRLWTRDQILGILAIATEEGVILNGKPPTEKFALRVLELYKTLIQKEAQ
jgi:hypothetical protein